MYFYKFLFFKKEVNFMKKIYQFLFMYIIKYTPECMRDIRSFFIRKYICTCGKNVSIGRCCFIHKNTFIGENSGIGYKCHINNGVQIGDNVLMGLEVLTYTQNHIFKDINIPIRKQGMSEISKIVIEDDVWIGARVCILPGVRIGRGSVIGAYSVIAKDIPPFSVVVGNPGKIIKKRK